MNRTIRRALVWGLGALTLAVHMGLLAQEATIRKNLGERHPRFQKIDGIAKSPMPGLFEVWLDRGEGVELYYTDAQGNFILQGSLWDTRERRDLTEERMMKLSAIDFDSLPLKDAFTIVRGNGARKMAVFEDPNCGYCKRFERDLQKVDNVTVYLFLYPILGAASMERSKAIWCAKEPTKAWLDWMVNDKAPTGIPNCDAAALTRNVEFGRKHRISGTPTLLFQDGSRVPGAINASQVERHLAGGR
jgi:thiol:disulfide interchange protein DsbC